MAEEEIQKGYHLENVLEKLLDFQASQGVKNCLDSMLMLSLVNLLGIISLLNKQAGVAAGQAPGLMNPLLGMLLNMFSGSCAQAREAQAEPGQGAFLPAMLMNLFSPEPGKALDPSAFFNMLGSLTGRFGSSPVPTGAQKQQEQKTRAESGISGKAKEIKKAEGPLKWDARLGR